MDNMNIKASDDDHSDMDNMDIKSGNEDHVEKKLCSSCQQEIKVGATVCHHCQRSQNKLIGYITHIATSTALIMVIIAGFQVWISVLQMRETKEKRVEANRVLAKAEEVLSTASEKSEKVISDANEVLRVAKNESEQAIREAKTVLENSTRQTSEAVQMAKEAKEQIFKSIAAVNEQIENMDKGIEDTEKDFKKKYSEINESIKKLKVELAKELEMLETRNELVLLADKAIGDGDRESFNKLRTIMKNSSDEDFGKKMAATSELLRVKDFYIGGTRIKNVKFPYTNAQNEAVKDEEIPTRVLIDSLLNSTNWGYRDKAAVLLKNRKEKKVPEALLKAMKTDSNLDVLRDCILSFSNITGYKKGDVLEYEPIIRWWYLNEKEVLDGLAD